MLWALPRFPGASHQVGIPPNLLQVLLRGRTCLFLGGPPSGNWSYRCSGSQTLMWVWNSSPSLQGGSPMGLYREQPLSGAIPHSAPSPASSPPIPSRQELFFHASLKQDINCASVQCHTKSQVIAPMLFPGLGRGICERSACWTSTRSCIQMSGTHEICVPMNPALGSGSDGAGALAETEESQLSHQSV